MWTAPRPSAHPADTKVPVQSLIPLPSAPTDNLYKFLALSGVAMMIGGATFPALTIRDLANKRVEVASDLLFVKAELESTKPHIEGTHEWAQDLRRAIAEADAAARDAGSDIAPEYRARLVKEAEEVIKQVAENDQRTQEVARLVARMDGKQLSVEALQDEASLLLKVGYLLFGIGSVLAVFGFGRWYTLYQRPQDDQMRRQIAEAAAKAKAEAATTPTPRTENRLPADAPAVSEKQAGAASPTENP